MTAVGAPICEGCGHAVTTDQAWWQDLTCGLVVHDHPRCYGTHTVDSPKCAWLAHPPTGGAA